MRKLTGNLTDLFYLTSNYCFSLHTMKVAILLYVVKLLFFIPDGALGAYQSAGCSDEGCGIPCYLRPASDTCHYTDHSDSPCDDGSGDDLLNELWFLNNTFVRLQDKLIQKGISEDDGRAELYHNEPILGTVNIIRAIY